MALRKVKGTMFRSRSIRKLGSLLALLLVAVGCDDYSSSPTPSPTTVVNVPFSQTDLEVGAGRQATVGSRVTTNYTGWLYDAGASEQKGRQFDTSAGRAPLTFVLGVRQVIAGWDQGLVGMQVGGRRRLIVPPSLAYGSTGTSGIPPNSTLVFDVELVGVTD